MAERGLSRRGLSAWLDEESTREVRTDGWTDGAGERGREGDAPARLPGGRRAGGLPQCGELLLQFEEQVHALQRGSP